MTTDFLYGPGGTWLEKQGSTYTATYIYANELIRKDGEYPLFDGLGSERMAAGRRLTHAGRVLNCDVAAGSGRLSLEDYSSAAIRRGVKNRAGEMLAEAPEPAEPVRLPDGSTGVPETGATAQVGNLVIIDLMENDGRTATIRRRGDNTLIEVGMIEASGYTIRLPRYVLPRLALRYLNMMRIQRNEDLCVEGAVPIRWRGRDHSVRVRLQPDREGIVIHLEA